MEILVYSGKKFGKNKKYYKYYAPFNQITLS
jgi:hypothetical protein